MKNVFNNEKKEKINSYIYKHFNEMAIEFDFIFDNYKAQKIVIDKANTGDFNKYKFKLDNDSNLLGNFLSFIFYL
jgi:hypothetical protein